MLKIQKKKKYWSFGNLNFDIVSNFVLRASNLRGFTLIELLIVMSIIAILAGAIWGNFFTSLNKGRDSRRKQDLSQISKALELYYNDMKVYPTALPGGGTPFSNPNSSTVIYMQKIPSEPSGDNPAYCYPTTAAGESYQLYAKLENLEDPNIFPTPVTVECGGEDYNYGISSPNTTP